MLESPKEINYDMNEFNKQNNRVTHYYTYLSFFVFIFGVSFIVVSRIINKKCPTWFASAIIANTIAVGVIGEFINAYGISEKLEVICPQKYLHKVDGKINLVNIECVKYSFNSNFKYHFLPLIVAIIMAFTLHHFCDFKTKSIPLSFLTIFLLMTVWLFCPDSETADILIDKIKLVYPEANFMSFIIGYPLVIITVLFVIQR